jgi:hypothetical protein
MFSQLVKPMVANKVMQADVVRLGFILGSSCIAYPCGALWLKLVLELGARRGVLPLWRFLCADMNWTYETDGEGDLLVP